jgi:hypothetical protein
MRVGLIDVAVNVAKATWNRDRPIHDDIEPSPEDRPLPIPFNPDGEEDTELICAVGKALQEWHR